MTEKKFGADKVALTITGQFAEDVERAIERAQVGDEVIRNILITCISGASEKHGPTVAIFGDQDCKIESRLRQMMADKLLGVTVPVTINVLPTTGTDMHGVNPYQPGFVYPDVTFPKF